MSGFRLKFQEMKENAADSSLKDKGEETHEYDGRVRNVCFVLLDGYSIDLSYAYLVAREYFQNDNRIILTFTSHIITMTGIWLKELYEAFRHHLPKQVACVDARYNDTAEDEAPIVNEIIIEKNS